MTRLIALQFSGWPRQCDPSPADNASAEKQAVSGGSGAPTATVAAAAGAGAGATCGSIWALDGLLEPVALRFRFHFEEERPTNRVDREFIFGDLGSSWCIECLLTRYLYALNGRGRYRYHVGRVPAWEGVDWLLSAPRL